MNVIFHASTAVGVAVLLTDTKKMTEPVRPGVIVSTGLSAFILAVISHGALDYIPHCYPVNSKIDALLSLLMIVTVTLLANRKYRIIVALSFIGSLFPDLIDLSPGILNKQLGFSLPAMDKIFPWHWHDYSGSIYVGSCVVSTVNHALLMLALSMVCWFRREDVAAIFGKPV